MSKFKKTFVLTHSNAAGIDIGRIQPFRGSPPDRDDQPVREFPSFTEDLHALTDWLTVCGVDLTRIDGIDVTTAFKVLAEVGADLSRFKDVKHFASWLGLCPGTKITGGKVISAATKPTTHRTAQALRMTAINLRNSQSALGAYYRRLCGCMDKGKAVTACAHKLYLTRSRLRIFQIAGILGLNVFLLVP